MAISAKTFFKLEMCPVLSVKSLNMNSFTSTFLLLRFSSEVEIQGVISLEYGGSNILLPDKHDMLSICVELENFCTLSHYFFLVATLR